MAARGGYQLPLDLHPEGHRCVTFLIPDDLFYIANFWGAIGELAKWTSYQRTGDDSGLQAAIVMSEVIDAARESFLSGCEGDAPLTPEIVEVVKYILLDNSDESEDCDDGDLAMCNCGKCGSAVYFDLESKKKYVMDAQCKRIYIEENETSPDLGGVEDWENAGEPPVPADLPVPHDNPLYQNNTEAQQCAKATAIVEEMWNLMSVYTAVEAGQTFSTTVIALFAWAAVQFPTAVPANLAAAWASFITTAISALGLEAIVNEMEPIYEDDAAKNEIICSIVSKMIPPEQVDFSWFGDTVSLPVKVNTIYASDIKAAVDAFKVAFPDASITTKWLNLFPLASWREIVTQKIPETLCGCEDYAPTDPNAGFLRLNYYFGDSVEANEMPDVSPTPADVIAGTSKIGTLVPPNDFVSAGVGGTNIGVSVMLEMTGGARLTNVKWTGVWGGADTGQDIHVGVYKSTGLNTGWTQVFETNANAPGNYPADAEFPGLAGIHYFWITVHVLGSAPGDGTSFTLDNLRADIAADDGSWTRLNVIPGQYIQP